MKVEKKKSEIKKEESSAEKKEKKALSGGVNIEDTKLGAGAVAKPGKVVMVMLISSLVSTYMCNVCLVTGSQ